ncbi:hypothetical protein [Rhizobium rhizogenes]|uniref:hypothetical protein n=1 Tax=Rhizobium rhizogenes TaxID=359 RepID=UPI00226FB328|nr:hypothetical protein [Rhizobium rhizogenes]
MAFDGKRRGSRVTGSDLDIQIQPARTMLRELYETVAHHLPAKDKTSGLDHAADIPLVLFMASPRIKNIQSA